MNKSHSRYREIPMEPCVSHCPDGGSPLKIVIYNKDKKLRMHAVKHFLNVHEVEDGWDRSPKLTLKWQNLAVMRDRLSDLGCPYYTQAKFPENPPCKHCSLFGGPCREVVRNLESEYVEILKTEIEDSTRIPRYVCYRQKKSNIPYVQFFSKNNVKTLANRCEGNMYSLVTGYISRYFASNKETVDYQARKIKNEAVAESLVWCSKENWNISATRRGKSHPSRKKPKAPYKKDSPGSWRNYLDGEDDN